MLSACVESLTDHLEELKAHFLAHWEELALDKDKVPLDPRYDVYLERDARGEVLLISLRDDGDLIGYFVGFVAPGLHYQTCLTLQMDIFWTSKRNGSPKGALMLFREVEREAKRRGVQRIFYGSKMYKDASVLFERLGMRPVETYYAKWIGD